MCEDANGITPAKFSNTVISIFFLTTENLWTSALNPKYTITVYKNNVIMRPKQLIGRKQPHSQTLVGWQPLGRNGTAEGRMHRRMTHSFNSLGLTASPHPDHTSPS